MLTKEEMTSLIWLRMHWESHYTVSFEALRKVSGKRSP
jgi:hypothetical protein